MQTVLSVVQTVVLSASSSDHTSLRFSSAIVESAEVVVELEDDALLLLVESEGDGVDILFKPRRRGPGARILHLRQ